MNPAYTKSLNELVEQFAKLPGIGSKTAERLAFYILKAQKPEALGSGPCYFRCQNQYPSVPRLYNLAETEVCSICSDPRRDQDVICVVEQPKDVISLEKTGLCKWIYHVLNGHIAPLEGIEPDDLTIDALIKRVRDRNRQRSGHGNQSEPRRGRHLAVYSFTAASLKCQGHPAGPGSARRFNH